MPRRAWRPARQFCIAALGFVSGARRLFHHLRRGRCAVSHRQYHALRRSLLWDLSLWLTLPRDCGETPWGNYVVVANLRACPAERCGVGTDVMACGGTP